MTRTAQVGWSDEFRIGLYGSTHKVLAPRGSKVVQPVELSRDWYHVAITVDPRHGRLVWSWIVGTAGADIAPAVAEWQVAGFTALVWDGLTAHHGAQVRAVGLALVEQPASSPELNPAERIGGAIRAKTEAKSMARSGRRWRRSKRSYAN